MSIAKLRKTSRKWEALNHFQFLEIRLAVGVNEISKILFYAAPVLKLLNFKIILLRN